MEKENKYCCYTGHPPPTWKITKINKYNARIYHQIICENYKEQ